MSEICAGPCERPMVRTKNRAAIPDDHAQHAARGFCYACYSAEWRRERAIDQPRRNRRTTDTVEDTRILLGNGLSTRAEIARELGLKPGSLYQAHRRAGVRCPV